MSNSISPKIRASYSEFKQTYHAAQKERSLPALEKDLDQLKKLKN